jgi:putative ubiquitin-RnfH superfamily antitoxin RatB of RatAB toxin-antitoxin module
MGPADPAKGALAVEVAVAVVYAPAPHQVDQVLLSLAPGATVADAVRASGLLARHGLVLDGLAVGVWGRACAPDLKLRERDRVEIYRALQVDPKEARRQRYKGKDKGKDTGKERPRSAAEVSDTPTR